MLAFLSAGVAAADPVPESAYGHIGTTEYAIVETVPDIPQGTGTVEALVREYFSDIPIMAEVARCESTFTHHTADGSVLQGRVDPRDTGVMQINKYYHEATAVAMGLDVEDFYDNLAYARNLYERQGVQPWSASQPCWGAHLAWAK